jgi:transporter family-2 protein
MTNVLYGLFATVAGIAAATQAAANSALASRLGLAPALVLNTCIVLVGTLLLYLASGRHGSFFSPGTPWSLYVGGICGFAIILSLTFVFPKVGAVVAIALMVLGQGIAALAIDHFGLMGMPREPITLLRVAGLLLVGGGVVLIRA